MQPTLGRLANTTNKPDVMTKRCACGWFVHRRGGLASLAAARHTVALQGGRVVTMGLGERPFWDWGLGLSPMRLGQPGSAVAGGSAVVTRHQACPEFCSHRPSWRQAAG